MLKKISLFSFLLQLISIRCNTFESSSSIRRADECEQERFLLRLRPVRSFSSSVVMTSASIDGIKRSNVCGDGYRIEGALLKSYPYTNQESYLPYENCYMTFKVTFLPRSSFSGRDAFLQARRADQQIRIRILSLDLNDIHAGVNCLDTLRFYQSAYTHRKDQLVRDEKNRRRLSTSDR